MLEYSIVQINDFNFNKNSLDNFVLSQVVTHCYRKIKDEYKLLPINYLEDRTLEEKRNIALRLLDETHQGCIGLAVIYKNQVIGFALLKNELFGSKKQYIDLAEFYISKPYRRKGIGKSLFDAVCEKAKEQGGRKLYISAHSAKESIAAYKKYGCNFAKEIDSAHVEKEPFDLQLEYDLKSIIYQVEDKQKYLDLLLLADEQEKMVRKYLDNVTMFVLDDDGVKGEICVVDIGNKTLEIKNLAVYQEFQNQGYGRKLIDFVCNKYKNEFDFVEVGTGDSPLTVPFYEKCGFSQSRVIKDFFKNHYDHLIFEDGILLNDMVILTKKLK